MFGGNLSNAQSKPAPLKRPRGAPKKDSHEKRTEVLVFRLTKSERNALRKAAEASSLSDSDYVRYATLRISPPRKASPSHADTGRALHGLHRLARELGPIGNNLNQIAHAANTGRTLSGKLDAALSDLQEKLAEARRLLEAVAEKYDC